MASTKIPKSGMHITSIVEGINYGKAAVAASKKVCSPATTAYTKALADTVKIANTPGMIGSTFETAQVGKIQSWFSAADTTCDKYKKPRPSSGGNVAQKTPGALDPSALDASISKIPTWAMAAGVVVAGVALAKLIK